MNSAGMECQLNRGGFTVKEIRALRQYLGESGVTYPVLLGQLRVRFIASVGMLALVAVGFVWTLMYEDFKTAIAATISLAIIFPVFLCVAGKAAEAYCGYKFVINELLCDKGQIKCWGQNE